MKIDVKIVVSAVGFWKVANCASGTHVIVAVRQSGAVTYTVASKFEMRMILSKAIKGAFRDTSNHQFASTSNCGIALSQIPALKLSTNANDFVKLISRILKRSSLWK